MADAILNKTMFSAEIAEVALLRVRREGAASQPAKAIKPVKAKKADPHKAAAKAKEAATDLKALEKGEAQKEKDKNKKARSLSTMEIKAHRLQQ